MVCSGWHWCTFLCAWDWIKEHPWLCITGAIVLLGAIGGAVMWPFRFQQLWQDRQEAKRRKARDEAKARIRKEVKKIDAESSQVGHSRTSSYAYYLERIKEEEDLVREVVDEEAANRQQRNNPPPRWHR